MLAEDIRIQASLNTTVIPALESNTSKNIERSSIITDDKRTAGEPSIQATQSDILRQYTDRESSLTIAKSSVLSDIHRENAQTTYSSETNEDLIVNDTMSLQNQQLPSSTKHDNAVVTNDSSYQQELPLSESFNVGNDVSFDTATKKESILRLELSKNILGVMRDTTSQQLSESTWIYVLDSGSQPQFADVSNAFVPGNTVIVIVHRLTDKLSSSNIEECN